MGKHFFILLLIIIIGIFLYYSLNGNKMTSKSSTNTSNMIEHDSGLKSIILKEAPSGAPQTKQGEMVTVHYTGWLYDPSQPGSKGAKFDSSIDRGQPFQFMLGKGMVIRGWDEGVALMKKGEKRRLIIPSNLGYGSRGVATIPPNATLLFDVEVL